MKVLFCDGLPTAYKQEVHGHWLESYEETSNPNHADIVVCGVNPINTELFANTKYFVCPATNADHVLNLSENKKLISLTGYTDFLDTITSTAEHTMCLMLMLARKQFEKMHSWNRYYYVGNTLAGKTLGIIGYGRVGKQVEWRAKAFGMKVLKHDKEPKTLDSRSDLLRLSDFITLHTSIPKQPYSLIKEVDISLMKEGVFLINTSRGKVLDEEAIIRHHKHFGGIALDVLHGEPQPPNLRELLKLPNVIITPHIAGCTVEDMNKTSRFCFKLFKEQYDKTA